jgi:hypothetical protein
MNTNLQQVSDCYDWAWMNFPCTNINNIDEMISAMGGNTNDIADFLTGQLLPPQTAHFYTVTKTTIHFSQEGTMCGPFSIIATGALDVSWADNMFTPDITARLLFPRLGNQMRST